MIDKFKQALKKYSLLFLLVCQKYMHDMHCIYYDKIKKVDIPHAYPYRKDALLYLWLI